MQGMISCFCVIDNCPILYPKFNDLIIKIPNFFQNTLKNSVVKSSLPGLLLLDMFFNTRVASFMEISPSIASFCESIDHSI